jgi:hypothetical protein
MDNRRGIWAKKLRTRVASGLSRKDKVQRNQSVSCQTVKARLATKLLGITG